MYEKILTAREVPVITVPQLAAFGRFDVPEQYDQASPPNVTEDWALLETFIEAATDEVETLAAQACLNEQILLTFDFFPGQQDPRQYLNYELSYAFNVTPWWWYGFPTKDSIELIRRPVLVPDTDSPPNNDVEVNYHDQSGVLQRLDPSLYIVENDKITLIPNQAWPLTSLRQDCVQITYFAGYGNDPAAVPARLKMAVLFLANHFYENRTIISVDPTSEVGMTLCRMLSSFRSMRIPR